MNAMNTTNTPTQPPDKCPACGAGKNSQDATKVHTYYDCGNRYSPVLVDNNGDKKLSWVWGGGCTRAFSAAEKLRAELEKTQARYNAEIEQFNAGYDAGKAGLDLQEQEKRWRMLHDNDYDAFAPGYAWGAFDKLRAERDDLQAMYQRAWEEIGQLRAERDALLADGRAMSAEIRRLEFERDEWKDRAENDNWPFEWQVATKLKAERDAALARAEKAEAKLAVTYCAYCGAEFPLSDDGNPDLVSEHIRTCDKHPMREVERQLFLFQHKAETYERDWFDAKHEFGVAMKQTQTELTAARARLAELQAALESIQEISEEEIRLGKADDSSIVWTLEANARAALASGGVVEGEVTK